MNRRYLERAFEDAHIIELRHQLGTRWISGTFNDIDCLLTVINERSGDGNLFITLNRPTGIKARNMSMKIGHMGSKFSDYMAGSLMASRV